MHTIGDSVLEHAEQYRLGLAGSTRDGRACLELPQESTYNTAANLYLAALSAIVKTQDERDAAQAALAALQLEVVMEIGLREAAQKRASEAQAALAAARIEGAKAMQAAAVKVAREFDTGPAEKFCEYLSSDIAALDPQAVADAKGGER